MAKGSDFEREMCQVLSLWWSGGERDDVFYRTQASGARATVRSRRGKSTAYQHGDMAPIDFEGEPLCNCWSVEFKTGYGRKLTKQEGKRKISNWCALDLIDSQQKETTLEKMWRQASEDAEKSNREPILIFRRNLMSPCIVVNKSYWVHLCHFFGPCPLRRLTLNKELGENPLVILSLKQFLNWIPDIRPALVGKMERRPQPARRRLM